MATNVITFKLISIKVITGHIDDFRDWIRHRRRRRRMNQMQQNPKHTRHFNTLMEFLNSEFRIPTLSMEIAFVRS